MRISDWSSDVCSSDLVGGSIPLGGRQANRGNVERAQAERLAAEAELAVARVERKREIDRLVAQRAALVTEIGRIDREVLPSAERAVVLRSGERRVGNGCGRLCRARWSPYH